MNLCLYARTQSSHNGQIIDFQFKYYDRFICSVKFKYKGILYSFLFSLEILKSTLCLYKFHIEGVQHNSASKFEEIPALMRDVLLRSVSINSVCTSRILACFPEFLVNFSLKYIIESNRARNKTLTIGLFSWPNLFFTL